MGQATSQEAEGGVMHEMLGSCVLVGVDGSLESADASRLGRRLSLASGGALRLLAAAYLPSLEVAALRSRMSIERVREALLARARERAVAGLEGILDPGAVEEALIVRIGRPEHVLAQTARELGADSIVLGGRRHGPPASWLDRGTAHHLLRTGEWPVVVTGPDRGAVQRVLGAVDVSFATRPTITAAARLAALLDVPLELIHVAAWPDLPRGELLDLDPPGPELEEAAEQELRAMMPPDVPLTVRRGAVTAILSRAAEEGPPALLVLGAQGRGWVDRLLLGSTTEAVLAALPCSLAIVPSSPDSLT
ncbi:MAG TPA: universal stress protein [Longimicrobiales bacterium]|nr:universal stress protein [Longimicrobiales bacterium]